MDTNEGKLWYESSATKSLIISYDMKRAKTSFVSRTLRTNAFRSIFLNKGSELHQPALISHTES